MSSRVVVKANYTPDMGAAGAHVRYIDRRGVEREPGERLWNAGGAVTREEARALLAAHRTRSVAATRLVISVEGPEDGRDLREVVREVMQDLAERRGQELHWVAAEHRDTDNPHCHVLLCGSGERWTSRGPRERLCKLSKEDLGGMRAKGDASYRELDRGEREIDRAIGAECDRELAQLGREEALRARERERERDATLEPERGRGWELPDREHERELPGWDWDR